MLGKPWSDVGSGKTGSNASPRVGALGLVGDPNEHPVCIVAGCGWGETAPIVVRVGHPAILVEAQLGLNWTNARRQPAWAELVRRADVVLAEKVPVRVTIRRVLVLLR